MTLYDMNSLTLSNRKLFDFNLKIYLNSKNNFSKEIFKWLQLYDRYKNFKRAIVPCQDALDVVTIIDLIRSYALFVVND